MRERRKEKNNKYIKRKREKLRINTQNGDAYGFGRKERILMKRRKRK